MNGMTLLWIVIGVVTIAIGVMMVQLRGVAPAPAATRKAAPRPRPAVVAKVAERERPAATRTAEPPALAGLEWDSPIVDVVRKQGDAARPGGATGVPNDIHNAQRAKIRGRYLAARFPGVARATADLLVPEKVIQSARLYFEERKLDRAIELLDLATRQSPADESLPLARLEIAFLMQDAVLYVAYAGAFRQAHPSSAQWDEVARLGRAIAPEEAMFGAADGPRETDHYGPWPDMPNWIQAPWDLTAEVRATEFHQAMARRAA